MDFTEEQIEKAKNCKSLDELKSLAKAEGIELTEEQALACFEATRSGELSDEDLSNVAGGTKGEKWIPIKIVDYYVTCPFCKTRHKLHMTRYKSNKSNWCRNEIKPSNRCTCGALIEFSFFTKNFSFTKNGDLRIVYGDEILH